MSLAPTVIRYLSRRGIPYDVINVASFRTVDQVTAATGIHASAIARAQVLMGRAGAVLVVVPGTDVPDVEGIQKLLGRSVAPASDWQLANIIHDCDGRFVPALGDAYGIRTLVDERLISSQQPEIYMFGGDDQQLVRFTRQAFLNLQETALFAQGLGKSQTAEAPREAGDTTQGRIKARLESLDALPMMPGMAQKVFLLRNKPNAGAADLAKVVELDPALAAQVIRYANSPFFGYRGRVDSVHTAISRVLGYEMVMNLALGIAAARPFKLPRHGPLGLSAFWRHAIYSATMMQVCSREVPRSLGLKPGACYLAGMLHNFGILLMGHLLKDEYDRLRTLVSQHPDRPLCELEQQVIGMTHGQLGARLLEMWGLPEEIVVAAREHHNDAYTGPQAAYARLAMVADCLLKTHNIGDASDGQIPPAVLASLSLDEFKLLGVMDWVLEGCTGLDVMARQLAA